jgi:hypothetical protein
MTGLDVASRNTRSSQRLGGVKERQWMKLCGSEAPQADAHAGVRERKERFSRAAPLG